MFQFEKYGFLVSLLKRFVEVSCAGHSTLDAIVSRTVASELILGLRPANERRRYKVTPSHWLGANLESALPACIACYTSQERVKDSFPVCNTRVLAIVEVSYMSFELYMCMPLYIKGLNIIHYIFIQLCRDPGFCTNQDLHSQKISHILP